uniref:AMP-activated protein kinase glycogen-binding domain-containing protein n=1 Tax=Auxenochlorella protothecoides TaxID=3075 RepID=A0A1D2AAK8_AUXPR
MGALHGLRLTCTAGYADVAARPAAVSPCRVDRLQTVKAELAHCRSFPPLLLPSHASPGHIPGRDPQPSPASNAVPFPGPADMPSLPGPLPRADAIRQLLPWLFLAAGRPDDRGLEALATQHALSTLRTLDLSRFAEGSVSGLPPHVRWVGSDKAPCPTIAASAALARLAVRAELGRKRGHDARGPDSAGPTDAVLAMHHPRHAPFVSEALWLVLQYHWGMPAPEAIEIVSDICGCAPIPAQASATALELERFVRGWSRRVTLAWPYGGASVEVVGDLVGGWHCRVPLQYNSWRREWRLQLLGLAPGLHRFKFIVDGRWCADVHAPLEHDFWGNANNVLRVGEGGRGGDAVATLGAALLSFYCKLR